MRMAEIEWLNVDIKSQLLLPIKLVFIFSGGDTFHKTQRTIFTLGNLLHRKMSILCFVKLIYREHYKQVEIPRSILLMSKDPRSI